MLTHMYYTQKDILSVACWVLYAYFIYELHQAFVYEI